MAVDTTLNQRGNIKRVNGDQLGMMDLVQLDIGDPQDEIPTYRHIMSEGEMTHCIIKRSSKR